MAVTSLVLGIIGALFGLIPLFFFIAFPCGLLALIFGVVGRRTAMTDPLRGGKGMATAGLILGLLGFGLAIVGIVVVANAFGG